MYVYTPHGADDSQQSTRGRPRDGTRTEEQNIKLFKILKKRIRRWTYYNFLIFNFYKLQITTLIP